MGLFRPIAAAVLAAVLLPDTPAAPPVRLDVVATDRHGRAVLDLDPAELIVKVNGRPQTPKSVELRTAPKAAAPSAAAIGSREDEPAAAREPGTRVFVFVLDEFHVSSGAPTARVREAVSGFVDAHLRPADMAAVFTPLDPIPAVRFTRDRTALRAAVAGFSGRRDDLAPRSAFEEQFMGRAPEAVAAARAQVMTVALTELALRLGELGAERAAMVLVSEGFERRAAPVRRTGRLPDLQGVVRAASRFNFTIYAFNPGESPAGAEDRAGATLEYLARQTGGLAARDGASLGAAFDRMARDLDGYYALTLDPGESDGRFRQVEVVAKRPGVEVRTRPGFWAPLSSEVTALLARTPSAPVTYRALKRSPLIDAWTGVRADASGGTEVVVSWVPPPRPVAGRPAPASVHLTARSAGGTPLFEGPVPAGGGATGHAVRFAAPAGRVELDLRIDAADGTALDTDIRDVTVPALGRGARPVLMPVEILHARTLREYRGMVAVRDGAPTPLRTFRRADRLIVRVPAWSADPSLRVRASILNRRAQPMRPAEPLDWQVPGMHAFDLPLAWLAPGEYYIEVSAADAAGETRTRFPIRITS